jgi:hypothetical protein
MDLGRSSPCRTVAIRTPRPIQNRSLNGEERCDGYRFAGRQGHTAYCNAPAALAALDRRLLASQPTRRKPGQCCAELWARCHGRPRPPRWAVHPSACPQGLSAAVDGVGRRPVANALCARLGRAGRGVLLRLSATRWSPYRSHQQDPVGGGSTSQRPAAGHYGPTDGGTRTGGRLPPGSRLWARRNLPIGHRPPNCRLLAARTPLGFPPSHHRCAGACQHSGQLSKRSAAELQTIRQAHRLEGRARVPFLYGGSARPVGLTAMKVRRCRTFYTIRVRLATLRT